MRGRRGRGTQRNMNRGFMDLDSEGGIDSGSRQGGVRVGESNEEKGRTTETEQYYTIFSF